MKRLLLPIAASICASSANAQFSNGSFEKNDYGNDDFKIGSELSGGSTLLGDKDAVATGWDFSSGGTANNVLKDTAGPNVATSHISFAIGLTDSYAEQKFVFANTGNYLFNVDVFIETKDKSNEYGWELYENTSSGSTVRFTDFGVKGNTGSELTLSEVVNISNISNSYTLRLYNKDSDGDKTFTYFDNVTVTPSKVPEPSSTLLLGLSGLALAIRRRR